MNQKPKPKSDDNLFVWGGVVVPDNTKKSEIPVVQSFHSDKDEFDETDSCTLCKNGGFCPLHTDRTSKIDFKKHLKFEDANDELQILSNSKKEEKLSQSEIVQKLEEIREKLK